MTTKLSIHKTEIQVGSVFCGTQGEVSFYIMELNILK